MLYIYMFKCLLLKFDFREFTAASPSPSSMCLTVNTHVYKYEFCRIVNLWTSFIDFPSLQTSLSSLMLEKGLSKRLHSHRDKVPALSRSKLEINHDCIHKLLRSSIFISVYSQKIRFGASRRRRRP